MMKVLIGQIRETGVMAGFMAGLTAAALICVLYHSMGRQKVATVNITRLINEFVQYESAQNFTPEKIKTDVKNFGRSLERDMAQFAKRNHVVLLPREAVIAGSVDYTNNFRDETIKKINKQVQTKPDRE